MSLGHNGDAHWESNGTPLVLSWANATSSAVHFQLLPFHSGYPTMQPMPSLLGEIFAEALQFWEQVCNVQFEQVADTAAASFRIGLGTGDGRGRTLATTISYEAGDHLSKAAISFDPADIGMERLSLLALSAHEIGHVLGLPHRDGPDALMTPYLSGSLRLLPMDILSLSEAYGPRTVEVKGAGTIVAGGAAYIDQGMDQIFYYSHQADVARAGMDANVHYALYGWREGRDPNAFFSTSWYLEQNPDVAAAGMNPLEHYLDFGWREGRDPSALFDTQNYLEANPDVAQAGANPLLHILGYGLSEGRALE